MSTLAFAASSSAPALAATAQRAPADTFQGASLRSAAVPEAAAAAGPASGVFEAALPLGLAGVGAVVLAGRSAKRATRSPLASAVALKAFENELGVQPPTGFWDPAGFCSDGDAKEFYRRRCVEIKHGRVSMLACLGYIVPEYFKFPGYLSATSGIKFADVGTGLSALLKVPAVGWFQWVFFCGYMELFACYQDPDLLPGKLSSRFVVGLTTIKSDTLSGWVFGPFGVPNAPSIADPELRKKKLNAEIANGRLAMMAIIGMFFQDGLTGSAWGDWALYTDSPLRAYENEAGVQAPVGFWDPLGLSASGSAFDFKRRREVELKHGRVCMFATIGYMVPEYTRLPGFLSPSYGVQFTDVPNGLSALSKVPALGWCQVVAFAGLIELNVYNEQINGEPGNYGAGFLGIRSIGLMSPGFKDPETRKKKLNAELANGRLAMMAIIGMFFQDGLTGSAWGDWALYTESPLRAFEAELGVQAPTGFWDPVGFTKDGDVEKFKRRRVTEIKHGRVAMLATMGYITPELTGKFPGYLSPAAGLKFEDIPNGLAAISKVPGAGWVQIVLYALFCESTGGFGYNSDGQKSDPGNCGWKPPLLATEDKDLRRKRLNAELANGRLAMMAIIGMFFQDGLTGSAWGDWALYTESPLRAFESELGVQAPLGFWDPIGYTADGSVENFKRRRQTELKHGRISMLATMGYITPELTGKFPGYLSPSMGLKFADIPNGLAALSKVPAIGWAQIIGYMSFCEISADQSPGTPGADGDFGFKVLTASDPAAKTRKLNAELANGRLAMMAIMGMFFQDGLTGSAWGDWALYTDSPLRAFENELGVQPPVGFWDPLEFTKDGSRENFLRRRAVEIKHGRVAMYACIGYFVPEYTKFSGDLSPSLGIKFSDVPNGLGAFSTVPLAGWLQIVAFCGFIENTGFTFSQRKKIGWMLDASMTSEKAEPGNYGLGWIGAFNTLKPIPALRQRKLNAELANGRLAMVAILAMFFQNGTFGTTGPEMWAIELPEYANTVGDFIPKNLA